MWSLPGESVSKERFEPFRPLKVLYEFDGPKTFTYVDSEGALYLAHWCDEDKEISRFIVVPILDKDVNRLAGGQLTLHQALDQSQIWVVDADDEGNLQACHTANIHDLPQEVLPKPGTMLYASLEQNPIRN